MKILRKWIKKVFPVMALFLVAGLILTRVFSPSGQLPTPEATIHISEAEAYVGKVMEVCGEVKSARFIPDIGGQPTFLNFGKSHPNQIFTVVIWDDDRIKWQQLPELAYIDQEICVTGRIEIHRDVPQIVIQSPEQVKSGN